MHAIARRVRTAVAICLAALLGTASRAAAVEPGWVEGQWIGGFEGVDGTVYVSADVEDEAGVLTGSLELPLQGDGAVKLEQVKATADALRVDVLGAHTRLAFDGHRREAGRITGTVHQGRGSASFELLKVATLRADRLDAIAGTYELEPGHNVLVARSQGGLIYVDQDRRKQTGDGGRRKEDLTRQLDRARPAAGGDCPNVPDHRPLRIEVRRADQQQSTLGILARNGGHHFVIDVARDQAKEGSGIGNRFVKGGGDD
jgi:hypothetical protein